MEDFLQFGAMGILGGVLYWGLRYAIPTTVARLTSSVDSLAKEVSGFRHTQNEVAKLLALLLSREFGPEKAAELLRDIEAKTDEQKETPTGRHR